VDHYLVQLYLHFFCQDLNNARFLWKRIPVPFKAEGSPSQPQLRDVWELGVALTKRDYKGLFGLLASGKGTEGQGNKVK
jgi:hypothetical protein